MGNAMCTTPCGTYAGKARPWQKDLAQIQQELSQQIQVIAPVRALPHQGYWVLTMNWDEHPGFGVNQVQSHRSPTPLAVFWGILTVGVRMHELLR